MTTAQETPVCRDRVPADAGVSLRPDTTSTALPDAPGRRDEQARMKGHLEVDVDAMAREEAVDVGIVERLDADDVRARREPGDLELAVVARAAKPPMSAPVSRLNATTCAPSSRRRCRGARVRAPPPVAARKSPSGYRSDTPAMSSGCSSRSRDAAAAERNREHHRAGAEHAAAAVRTQLRFAERRMAEADEVTDLVQRHRLEIEAAGSPAAAVDHGNAELKKTSDSTISPVTMSTTKPGRAEHPLQLRLVLEPEHRQAVVVERLAPVKPTNWNAIDRRRHRLPCGERARHRRLELGRRDAGRPAFGGEPAHRRRSHRSRVAVDQREVRDRRAPAERRRAPAAGHGGRQQQRIEHASPCTLHDRRTSRANASSASGGARDRRERRGRRRPGRSGVTIARSRARVTR